jgi:N-acetylneuraminic acid mutarotase
MPLIESLEPRQLLAFALHVNFQPAGAAVPAGYLADTGAVFANRGNGFSYGWNADASAAARDRNSPKALDQRYDTFIHTQAFGTRTWEAAVPNGQYSVHLIGGDPSFYDSVIKFDAEGSPLASGTPTSTGPFIEGTRLVTVSDGRLTITNAAGASNNKICFIDITSSDVPPPSGFNAKINFQPAGAATPAGYWADTGLAFGNRGNGLSYGWSADNTANTRDRNAANSPDQRYDTLDHFKSLSWELAVPNGQYSVRVVVGDPSYIDSVYGLSAEGAKIVEGTPTNAIHWFDSTVILPVSDGRLTLTNSPGSSNNRICFIEVSSFANNLPIVKVTAPDPNGQESPALMNAKDFVLTRGGDTSKALTVNIAMSGTATNGSDYDSIGPTATFAAGSATTSVRLFIIEDSIPEPTESAILTILSGSGYTVGSPSKATINIADDDSTGTTITWTTGKSSPIARSEAMTATIDGKMYVLGGYANGVFTPTNRVDVYDPAANSWTRLENSNMPLATSHSGCTVLGRSIILAGGYPVGAGGTGQTFSTTGVWSLNVDTGVWTTLPSLPAARGGGALVNFDGTLHFFGGADSARKDANTHWQLTPGASSWTTLAPLPTNRNHMGAVALGGKIYAVGGQQNQDANEIPQSALEIYDPASNSWSAGKSLPFGRSHIAGATVLVNGRIVVLGGETTFNSTVKSVSAYDPGVNDWLPMTDLPVSINSGVAAFINGELIYSTGRFATATYRGTIS